MLSFYSHKALQFDRPDPSEKDGVAIFVAKPGLNRAPDWVGEHDYFAMNVKDGTISQFDSLLDADKAQDQAEQAAAKRRELEDLDRQIAEKKALLAGDTAPDGNAVPDEKAAGRQKK